MSTELPPRFQPDNSPEARRRRMSQHLFATAIVREVTPPRHRITEDTFADQPKQNIVLGQNGNVIEVNFRQDPPEDLVA